MNSIEYATTADGARIAWRLHLGSGSARCVLVHSLALDHRFWDVVLPLLHGLGEVLVYDCRGHGLSDKPHGAFSVQQHADDLAAVLDAVGWPTALVAGASMGGCIALAFAAAYPQRVAGLGLFDTTAWYGPNAPQQWEERGQKGVTEGMAALAGFQKSRWVTEAFLASHPEVVEAALAVFLASDTASYLQTCRMLGAADLRAALPDIACPTRIVVGAEDYATPVAMAEALHAALPGATLRVLAGARHLTPLECPQVIADELTALAATVAAAAA
jgi:3-oxoadipate enol-lactonase